MAVERSTPDFGTISRIKGTVFEYLSLSASVVGIVMLAVLLIYVVIDAFQLAEASLELVAVYSLTVIAPFLAFCLYSVNDRDLTRQTLLVLGGGLVGTFVLFNGFEMLIQSIPRLTWYLAYIFGIVVPVTASVSYLGSREPVGATGFGLVGRLLGGMGLGIALVILFIVFNPRRWFWAYTMGVLPAIAILAYGRLRQQSAATLLVVPVVLCGFLIAVKQRSPTVFALYLATLSVPVAIAVREQLADQAGTNRGNLFGALTLVAGGAVAAGVSVAGYAPEYILGAYASYPITWVIYVWTLAIPVCLAIVGLLALEMSRRSALTTGGVAFVLVVVGSQAGALVDVAPAKTLLFLLTTALPSVAFIRRVSESGSGTVGISLPLLIAGGIAAGTAIVATTGITTPDPWLDGSFLQNAASSTPSEAGLYPAIIGSVLIIAMVALFSFVLGVGTAVFLEDYTPDTGVFAAITRIVQINIANLAAVPSIVYGLLGLGVFVNLLGFGLGTAITAALTLSLLILPITIISAQEAIRSVPDDLRKGSYAMGATRWQTTKNVVLPEALSGILTGTILSLGRAIGETAPLIMIGAPNVVFRAPEGILDKTAAMPMQIFIWSGSAQTEFQYGVLAAGVVTLLVVLIGMNAAAIIIRNRSERSS